MKQQYESKYHSLEESHWWFRARRDAISRLLSSESKSSSVLDIGCSAGTLIEFLQGQGFSKLSGLDISSKAVEKCRQKGIQARLANAIKTGFRAGEFDTVVASDVLEHIESQESALCEWNRVLKPGGKLLVFVPAFQSLWSGHDETNMHFRRYNRKQLEAALKNNGFSVERTGYWNFSLFAPIALLKLLQRNAKADQLRPAGNALNRLLLGLLLLENRLIAAGLNFPFGVSAFAIARKRG